MSTGAFSTKPGANAHCDGWHVTPQAKVATCIVAAPAAIIGFILTLSVWFMTGGFPLLVGGALSIKGVLQADVPGTPHPAVFVSILALIEGAFGLVILDAPSNNTGRMIGAVFLGASGITGLAGWIVRWQTEPLTPPPPRRDIGFS